MKYTLEEAKKLIEFEKDNLIGKPMINKWGDKVSNVTNLVFSP